LLVSYTVELCSADCAVTEVVLLHSKRGFVNKHHYQTIRCWIMHKCLCFR